MPSSNSIHEQFVQAFNSRDFAAFGALMHPEYSYTGPDGVEHTGGPSAGVAVAQMYTKAFPDCTLELIRSYRLGDIEVAEMKAQGTHTADLMGIPATNRKVDIKICNVAELRDGKIHREREYFDRLLMMTQLGVIAAPGASASA